MIYSLHSSPGSLSHMLAPKKSGHSSGPKYPAGAPNPQPIFIDGTKIALRLKKSQIDKAFKDKMCKVFSEDFNVTLFMTKPRSQVRARSVQTFPIQGPT